MTTRTAATGSSRATRASRRAPAAAEGGPRPDLRILETRVLRGPNYWAREPVIRSLVDRMRLVSDAAMIAAVGHLLVKERLVAEPSGAATVAAFVADAPEARPEHAVLLITGCNVTPEILRKAIAKATEG